MVLSVSPSWTTYWKNSCAPGVGVALGNAVLVVDDPVSVWGVVTITSGSLETAVVPDAEPRPWLWVRASAFACKPPLST